jgi:phospholipase C
MNPKQKPDDPIKHVVLLLFENHSFDQMLGCFKTVYTELAGVDPEDPAVNRANGKEFRQIAVTERQMELDPHHEVDHVKVQMENHNGGFVEDFYDSHKDDKHTTKADLDQQCQYVIGYYPLDFLPALHRLARDFLICDQWFSSVPGPTWTNRFFVLSGTSNGKVNMPTDGTHVLDLEGWFQQDQVTLFDRLTEQGISWQIYFHDIPQSICLMHQRQPEMVARYVGIEQFFQDAGGQEQFFPAFSFIEPDYNGATENDDHPPHDVMKAQKLMADVYNALRANDGLWASTLLVVVYDEHGGFFDHVESPNAVPPSSPQPNWEYSFNRLGIRVPALLISPWVKQGFDHTTFDHTSLLKYLAEKWSLGSLGDRTAQANSIGTLTKKEPRAVSPNPIGLTPDQLRPPNPDLEEKAVDYVSAHHAALALLARRLQLELLKESPLTFAWIGYVCECVAHWLFGIANSMWFGWIRNRIKKHWLDFMARRKEQAIPRLSQIIQDVNRSLVEKHHACETLALAVNQSFHRAPDAIQAAQLWIQKNAARTKGP